MAAPESSLRIGDTAPDFKLTAANSKSQFSLADLRRDGPVVIEFVRGTW